MAGQSPLQNSRVSLSARRIYFNPFHALHAKRADRKAQEFASTIASFPAVPSSSMLHPSTDNTNDDGPFQQQYRCPVRRGKTTGTGMERLIPLVLGSSASSVSSRRDSAILNINISRSSSVGAESSPVILLPIIPSPRTLTYPNSTTPLVPEAISLKSDQRLPPPPRPKPVTDLIIMPTTRKEWRSVMDEVRMLYLRRQHKQCSTRCEQILSGIEDPYRTHPLYLIYLSFYAGTCIELTARAMHANSSEKIPLLRKSLKYYEKAESHMEYATFSADPTIISASQNRDLLSQTTSDSSSARSSIDSVFSQDSTACSDALLSPNSPTSSIFSSGKEDESIPKPSSQKPQTCKTPREFEPLPLKVKKTVSFSLPSGLSRKICKRSSTSEDPIMSSASNESLNPSASSPSETPSYLLSPAHARYMQHLTSLSAQLRYHQDSVRELIRSIHTSRKARRSNTPEIFHEFSRTAAVAARGGTFEEANEECKKDLQQRIERLKERGWRKERFCAEKYQELCAQAMAELDMNRWD
ncbi:hypothetical protein BP5796_05948 [Coleophoma crateriformis]|uniref:Uncharacterized protein n=1 Tax=Coleophoma crateriformis TaxID=565419 RepID=A0A3D8RVT8_9HELO|nr:hypothetical protein BP5796_05948 [Coleophoma crateriformis]